MAVRTVRFYRADSRQTLVKAFVQIPYVLFAGSGVHGGRAGGIPGDGQGVRLHRSRPAAGALDQSASRPRPRSPAYSAWRCSNSRCLEGRYRLEVTVEDTATGRKGAAAADVLGFPAPPSVSDLLLSPQIRIATAGDTVPQAGELRVGSTLVTGAVELHLTPLRSQAFYLIEAYRAESASGTLTVAVRDHAGKSLFKTPPSTVNVPAGGGVLKGPARPDRAARRQLHDGGEPGTGGTDHRAGT